MEKTFKEMVVEIITNASVNVSNRGYSETDAYDFADDFARQYTSDLYEMLEYVKDYCTDNKVTDAIETVLDLVYYAKYEKDNINNNIDTYTKALETEKRDNNRETVNRVYDSLTENAKVWLALQGYKNSEDVLEYVLQDYDYTDYVMADDVKWYIEDLLTEEVKANGKESLYN